MGVCPSTLWESTEVLPALHGACAQDSAGMCSAASTLLWDCSAFPCLLVSGDCAIELKIRRGPMEGHVNVLYPWIGTCLSM